MSGLRKDNLEDICSMCTSDQSVQPCTFRSSLILKRNDYLYAFTLLEWNKLLGIYVW